ncbi:MAG: hypothetical protein JW720_06565, partial [Sedimentisphaerales bacterium]|nr:hypothetical protein [Sedimentisphaerales bacterium]
MNGTGFKTMIVVFLALALLGGQALAGSDDEGLRRGDEGRGQERGLRLRDEVRGEGDQGRGMIRGGRGRGIQGDGEAMIRDRRGVDADADMRPGDGPMTRGDVRRDAGRDRQGDGAAMVRGDRGRGRNRRDIRPDDAPIAGDKASMAAPMIRWGRRFRVDRDTLRDERPAIRRWRDVRGRGLGVVGGRGIGRGLRAGRGQGFTLGLGRGLGIGARQGMGAGIGRGMGRG